MALAALMLAASPALADEFMVAALDRCLPGLYRGTLEGKKGGGCARYLLRHCDSRPDPTDCKVSILRAVSSRIVDLTGSPGKPSAPKTPPNNGFDCRSAFNDSYCDIWDEAGRLDALVINAAQQRLPLDFSTPAAVADDLDLPMREFDRCLDHAAASAAVRGEPVTLGPEGLMCAEFLSIECRIMAHPSACMTHVSATLRDRIATITPLRHPQYRVSPDLRPRHSAEEVALINLALQVAEARLTSSGDNAQAGNSP